MMRRTLSTWSLLTNHAYVLIALHRDPDARQREIADLLSVTQGTVQRILQDLIASGHVTRVRVGRRNHYEVNPNAQLQHPVAGTTALTPLLDLLASSASTDVDRARPNERAA